MTDVRITDLTEMPELQTGDILVMVDNGATPVTRKVSALSLASFINGRANGVKPDFVIYGEEQTITDGAFEYSFGANDSTPQAQGVVLAYDCDLVRASANVEMSSSESSGQFNVLKNGSFASAITGHFTTTYNTFVTGYDDAPISYSKGDTINFQTSTFTGESNIDSVRLAAYFRVTEFD